MPRYEVIMRISLMPVEVDAEDENEAIDKAVDLVKSGNAEDIFRNLDCDEVINLDEEPY
jgi:hypothetical protein